MPSKRHKAEEIVAKLRQVEVLSGQGQSVAEARNPYRSDRRSSSSNGEITTIQSGHTHRLDIDLRHPRR